MGHHSSTYGQYVSHILMHTGIRPVCLSQRLHFRMLDYYQFIIMVYILVRIYTPAYMFGVHTSTGTNYVILILYSCRA